LPGEVAFHPSVRTPEENPLVIGMALRHFGFLMISIGQKVAGVFGRKNKWSHITLTGGADAEITQALNLIKDGKIRDAFSALNGLKSRQVPLRHADYLRALCFLENRREADAVQALKEELRWFPNNAPARSLLAELETPPDQNSTADPEFRQWLTVIRNYTMVGERRLLSLHRLAGAVCAEDLPGNFVECGVAAGGSSALLAAVIKQHSKRPRKLFSFDTFSGMPAASAQDTHRGHSAQATGWGAGTCSAPEASLAEVCGKLNVAHLVEPVKGLFQDTLPQSVKRIGPIALLHMDGDWYSSTRDILQNLYDSVVSGGRIQVDDYGYWEGCKKAVSEFEHQRGLAFNLNRIDETGVWFVK
jgi:hypothetical protein